MRALLLFLSFIFIAGTAQAACTNPAGVAGTMDYFGAPENTYKFCDGSQWIKMSGGGAGGGPISNWPDAIDCAYGDTNTRVMFNRMGISPGEIMYSGAAFTYMIFSDSTGQFLSCSNCDAGLPDCTTSLTNIMQAGRGYYFLQHMP